MSLALLHSFPLFLCLICFICSPSTHTCVVICYQVTVHLKGCPHSNRLFKDGQCCSIPARLQGVSDQSNVYRLELPKHLCVCVFSQQMYRWPLHALGRVTSTHVPIFSNSAAQMCSDWSVMDPHQDAVTGYLLLEWS